MYSTLPLFFGVGSTISSDRPGSCKNNYQYKTCTYFFRWVIRLLFLSCGISLVVNQEVVLFFGHIVGVEMDNTHIFFVFNDGC